jgi:site-specific recombinase XerD
MPIIAHAIEQLRMHPERRNDAAHTVESYLLDLQLFFAAVDTPLHQISFQAVDRVIEQHYHNGLTPTTIKRRLSALKHFFDCLIAHQIVGANPVTPRHALRRGRNSPRALAEEQVEQLFAHIQHPMDHTLLLGTRRGGGTGVGSGAAETRGYRLVPAGPADYTRKRPQRSPAYARA